MPRVYKDGSRFVVEHAGHRIWSSDGRPVNLLQPSTWLTPSLTISFPDFVHRNAYVYHLSPSSSAMSLATILPEERYPGAPGAMDLPQQVLGTVPAGVNYLDVRLQLTRTKAPTDYLYKPVANQVPPDMTLAPGGSVLCEYTGLWSRAFEIVLDGTNVVLRRRQSVISTEPTLPWNVPNDNWTGSGGRRNGWTHGGGTDSDKAYPAAVISISPYAEDPSLFKIRGESHQASLVDTTDFSSTWSGSAVIKPGYIAP